LLTNFPKGCKSHNYLLLKRKSRGQQPTASKAEKTTGLPYPSTHGRLRRFIKGYCPAFLPRVDFIKIKGNHPKQAYRIMIFIPD
jgi:hypothetical protein